MPRKTSAVSRSGSVVTWPTSTPSAASRSRTNRPRCSSPTRVSMAGFMPSRARPTAVLAGEPPRYFANERMSSSRPPICSPYRSTAARPMQITSNGRAEAAGIAGRGVPTVIAASATTWTVRLAPCGRDLVTGADDQRLREAERTDKRAERPGRVVAELEADAGGRLQQRQAAVGDRDHRDAALAAGERGL